MANSTDTSTPMVSSSTKLGGLSVAQLLKLIKSVEKPFDGRDEKWRARRKVRYRQMEQELMALPLSNRAGSNKALMVWQSEEPNQEIHRRTKRLIANKPRFETIIYDNDPEQKELAQQIKDALAALYKWLNRAKVPAERGVVEHQQGDGLGIFKLDFLADFDSDVMQYYDPESLELDESEVTGELAPGQVKARKLYAKVKQQLAGETDDVTGEPKYLEGVDLEAIAYKKTTDAAKRTCDPPFRLSSVDPMTLKWRKDGDGPSLVIEKGKRSVNALLDAFGTKGLRLANNRLVVMTSGAGEDAVSPDTIPENESLDGNYDDQVDYTEIRNRHEIIILMRHPKLREGGGRQSRGEDGYEKIVFENPFGPYSTGYVFVPGDITGSHDPADEFQPPVLGTLNVAQPLNVLRTIRLSAAIDAALRGKYIKVADASPAPQLDQSKTDKTPTVKDGKEIAQIPGEVKREEAPDVDLSKAEQAFTVIQAEHRFNEVLAGDATSSDSGHKLAIQVSQADTQLVPYQTTRAEATAEVLMCCLYAAKKLGVTIYVRELPDPSLTMNKMELVQPTRAITPEMFDLDFQLIVSIGSETPVTKFAKWSALAQRYKEGTLSLETLMEESDVENVGDEIARIFEGQTLVASMQQVIPVMTQMVMQKILAKLAPPTPPGDAAGAGGGGGGGESPVIGAGGNENGGGMAGAQESTPIAGRGRLPGVGLNAAGPTTGEYGPRVLEGGGDVGGGT